MEYDASLFDESIFSDSAIADIAQAQWELEEAMAGTDLSPGGGALEDRFDCVLAAGDASDLPGLREWCAALPDDSYGRVFVEVFSPIQIERLEAPAGVAVTWICRERLRESTRPGVGIARCQALSEAVDAWLDEWYRSEFGPELHFTIWMGARSSSIMRGFWKGVENEVAEAWSER